MFDEGEPSQFCGCSTVLLNVFSSCVICFVFCFVFQCQPPPSTKPSQWSSSCAKCWIYTTLTSSLALSQTRTGSNSPKKSKVKPRSAQCAWMCMLCHSLTNMFLRLLERCFFLFLTRSEGGGDTLWNHAEEVPRLQRDPSACQPSNVSQPLGGRGNRRLQEDRVCLV